MVNKNIVISVKVYIEPAAERAAASSSLKGFPMIFRLVGYTKGAVAAYFEKNSDRIKKR